MRLIINTTDGGNLTVADFDAASLMQLLEDWDALNVFTFALNDGVTYIPKAAIARIDAFDSEE